MSFEQEALAFLKSRRPENSDEGEILHLDTPAQTEAFIRYLRQTYENATETEINRALNQVMEDLPRPFHKKTFLQKMRVKLED
ncbi:MAG: hypothetical protein ACI4QM_03225 [Alphaproteobacteria bacterium]